MALRLAAIFLAARTGTARYEGIAYGSGISSDGLAHYDVNGTSQFDVDFGAQTFGGGMALAGADTSSGAQRDFGAYDVAGTLSAQGSAMRGTISREGTGFGALDAFFYGADAQEIAGTFHLNTPATGGENREVSIMGAVAATRR
ncbi:MAG: transferrin-binding protein-like solute binding protein [Sphingobium sp.]